MFDRNLIEKNLKNTLDSTDFKGLGTKLKGKVRDVYTKNDKIFLIATDRQSAFDRNLALVPFKGQVLTQTSAFWFTQTSDIIQNHVLAHPDPNVVVGRKLTIFPVEFVVRGYLTGVTDTAVWTAYARGERDFCGNRLPEGMTKNERFEKPLITPTTKSTEHDEKITPAEIVSQKLMTQQQWDYVADKALKIFQRGAEISAEHNLILVDTKYEFGYDENGTIYLCDEIHTPDSSRFWLKDSYEQRIREGKEPENIDKEFLRLWFKEHCDPYKDKILPEAPAELIIELSARYIRLYEMITGKTFSVLDVPVRDRMTRNLKDAGFMD